MGASLAALALLACTSSRLKGADPGIDEHEMPALVDTDERRGVAVFRRHEGDYLTLQVGRRDAVSGLRLEMVGASVVIVEISGDDPAIDRFPLRLRMEREADGGRITSISDRVPTEALQLHESWHIEAMTPGDRPSATEEGK